MKLSAAQEQVVATIRRDNGMFGPPPGWSGETQSLSAEEWAGLAGSGLLVARPLDHFVASGELTAEYVAQQKACSPYGELVHMWQLDEQIGGPK